MASRAACARSSPGNETRRSHRGRSGCRPPRRSRAPARRCPERPAARGSRNVGPAERMVGPGASDRGRSRPVLPPGRRTKGAGREVDLMMALDHQHAWNSEARRATAGARWRRDGWERADRPWRTPIVGGHGGGTGVRDSKPDAGEGCGAATSGPGLAATILRVAPHFAADAVELVDQVVHVFARRGLGLG